MKNNFLSNRLRIIYLLFIFISCINSTNKDFNNKFYYISKNGEKIFNKSFEYASPFFNKIGLIMENRKFKFININGDLITKVNFDFALPFQENFAVVAKNKKLGYIDNNGQYIAKPQFKEASSFINGLACISFDKVKYGYINTFGEIITDIQYENISYSSEGLINVKFDGKWGYINNNGKCIINYIYDDAKPFQDEVAFIEIENKWGVINKVGEIIIDPQYDLFTNLNNSNFIEIYRNQIAAINDSNDYETNYVMALYEYFKYGYAIVKSDNKLGIIDKQGNQIINFKYDYIYLAASNYFFCENSNSLSIRNYNDEIITVFPEGYKMRQFHNGYSIFHTTDTNKVGIIDYLGNIVINPEYDSLYLFVDTITSFKLDNKFGFIDENGNVLITPQFSYATPFYENYTVVKQ